MGECHHIHLATKISFTVSADSIEDENLLLLLPLPYRDDFDWHPSFLTIHFLFKFEVFN